MPLTGGRRGAESGELILLVGGDAAALETLKPDLAAISAKIVYFGPAGSGARYKLVLNALQAVHIIGLGEALKLAEKCGLDQKTVGDALAEYPGGVITARTWSLHNTPSEQTNFAVKWLAKDLSYAKDLANDLDLPLLDDVSAKYDEAVKQGLGDRDYGEAMKI
jgi:3-hydroxyisobutyrate dehydrogenase